MAPSPVAEAETLRADVADRKRREGRGRGTVWSILLAGFATSMAAAGPFLVTAAGPMVVAGFDSSVDPANPLVFSGAAVLAVATLASRWLGLAANRLWRVRGQPISHVVVSCEGLEPDYQETPQCPIAPVGRYSVPLTTMPPQPS
jgi:hypothetical protein